MRNQNILILVSFLISISSCKQSEVEPDPLFPLTVTTLAGSGQAGFANATGTSAIFNQPKGIAADGSGNFYVADYENNRIRKITPGGNVSTFAGSGTAGAYNGIGKAATFYHPYGIAVDRSGTVYVSDYGNSLIRKITPDGAVSTFIDNTGAMGLATDASGNLYVADAAGNVIVKISSAGVADTLAGSSASGFKNAIGAEALFNYPVGVAVDASGNVYVADYNNSAIRKITPAKEVSTLAGSGVSGFLDATGTSAVFANPSGLVLDNLGNVYVTDTYNHKIRKITGAVVTTLAGSDAPGFANGIGTSAFFKLPTGIAILPASNNLYVADTGNNAIRKIVN